MFDKMKEIKLSQQGKNKGKFVALVDDIDFKYLNQFRWYVQKGENTYYASRKIYYDDRTRHNIKMHRFILNTPDNMEIDHIDHNGLNNQRSNIRNCTKSQNAINRKTFGSSEFIGINPFLQKCGKKRYRARLVINGKFISLGCYTNEIEAAITYDISAMIYHKEFAKTNFKYADWFKKHLYLTDGKISQNQKQK
jgi:hypothetical protein